MRRHRRGFGASVDRGRSEENLIRRIEVLGWRTSGLVVLVLTVVMFWYYHHARQVRVDRWGASGLEIS